MKRITTKYVAMNPRHCVACWECVEKCPKQVIGKVGFLWHKHVVFNDVDACIGCNKCIKTCPNGVFFKTDEAVLSGRSFHNSFSSNCRKTKTSFKLGWLLLFALVSSAVSGIGLHIAGHGNSHEIWHSWAVAHILSSLILLVSGVFHIKRHWAWCKTIISKGLGKKSLITLALTVTFIVVVITGIVLIACVDGANSTIGLWHYKIGLMLIVFSILHIVKKVRRLIYTIIH